MTEVVFFVFFFFWHFYYFYCSVLLIMLEFKDTATHVEHFVSSPREREKKRLDFTSQNWLRVIINGEV